MSERLGFKERFSTTVVLVIGIAFLAMELMSVFSSRSSNYAFNEQSLVISKSELFADIRTWVTAVLGIVGAFLLMRRRKAGWVIGTALLSLYTVIAAAGAISLIIYRIFDVSFALVCIISLLLLTALIFLTLPSTRQKYKVSRRTFLLTFVFFMSLAALYYFLQ